MKISNADADLFLQNALKHTDTKNVLGYAVSRNIRNLRESLEEFSRVKLNLMMKYGEQQKDEKGRETGNYFIKNTSPNIIDFMSEFNDILNIEHDVEIMKVDIDKCLDQLDAQGILDLEFMIND